MDLRRGCFSDKNIDFSFFYMCKMHSKILQKYRYLTEPGTVFKATGFLYSPFVLLIYDKY